MLLNCPFHRLAAGHTDVVCAMNGAFLGGAAAALGIDPGRVEALDIEELREQGSARAGAVLRPDPAFVNPGLQPEAG